MSPPPDITCPVHTRLNGHLHPAPLAIQTDPDDLCSHEDRGTCGNACCTIQTVGTTQCDAECAKKKIVLEVMQKGNGMTLKNITNVKNFGLGNRAVEFLISVSRVSKDGRTQNLLFSVGSSDIFKGEAVVKGFSESKASRESSFRDYGQNYRNLVSMFRSMGGTFGASNLVLIHGCGRNGLIREQGASVLLIGAGTIGLIIGGIVAASLNLCVGKKKSRKNKRSTSTLN